MSDDIGTVERVDAADGTIIRVTSGLPASRAARAEQLTDRVYQIITELNASVSRPDSAVIVDFRMESERGDPAWPSANAYLEAVRGLVQSLTLELSSPAPAINIVVSTQAESAARDRTIEYLRSEDGRFARGTTYDLRSSR